MSDGSTGAIGPVSVRYAAQIRELLYAQAVQRMAEDAEAARNRSDAERSEANTKATEPLDVKVQAPEPQKSAPAKQPDAPAEKPATTGQLVDIQA